MNNVPVRAPRRECDEGQESMSARRAAATPLDLMVENLHVMWRIVCLRTVRDFQP